MIRTLLSFCALAALVACGDGSPFGGPVTDDDVEESDIPEAIASAVTSFSYTPGANTLSLTGALRDGDERTTTYRRRPALDVLDDNTGAVVYEAYTAQDDPLDEHTTVYARVVGDVAGATAVTGGQFTYYSGGAAYGRGGGFDPAPENEDSDTGLVTYAGQYAGLTNLNGPQTDLLPVPAGVSNAVLPSQGGPVTGRVFINVSFSDNSVAGVIYDRRVDSDRFGQFNVSNLILVPTELDADGTFTGEVELPSVRTDVGTYAGTIGSNRAEAMAGALYVDDHFDDTLDNNGDPILNVDGSQVVISGEEEFGIFVLGRCGGALEDPSAECDAVDPL